MREHVLRIGRICVGSAGAVMLGSSAPVAHTKTTQVTWTTDVGPIVQSRCVSCHRPNGFAPVPLATYEDAQPRANSIRDEVLAGRMPPWSAVKGFGDFSNDASLTPVEMELLARWAEGGAPLGPPVARVKKPAEEHGSTLRLDLPAVEVSDRSTERFELTTALDEDRWISSWEFQPGAAAIVEEASVTIGAHATLGAWTPFDSRVDFPRGTGQRLPRGTRVGVSVRYRKTSEPQTDRSTLTLRFGPRPAREIHHGSFSCGSHTIDRDVNVLAVQPRAARAGDSIEVVAHRPGGTVEPLCVVSQYQPAYAVTYRLRTPVRLPTATRLDVRSSSDACAAALDYVLP